jgi:6,7-dimethyl-8-ribityllumazine synthase
MNKAILIVVSPYYHDIAGQLIEGATRAIYDAGHDAEMIDVPGAFEIPAAIAMAESTGRYAGYVALGCVIRGETSHYDHICHESARGLQQLGVAQHTAIGNGILTCENKEQAALRADPARGDKGGEAARACLRMIAIRQLFGLAS